MPRPGGGRGRTGGRPATVAAHTRDTILDAALRAFAAREFAATSLRDVPAAAGTTHGLTHHQFRVRGTFRLPDHPGGGATASRRSAARRHGGSRASIRA